MEPLMKFTLQDLPDDTKREDALCQECYESIGPTEARRNVPRISRLQVSSESCPGCRTLLDFIVTAQHQSNRPVSVSNPFNIGRSWAYWVNEYSRAKPNKNKDETTALLGLIAFVQDLKQDESLLGLWKEDIAEGLLWERGVWEEPAGRKRIAPFPSWTWMSLPGAVQYPSFSLATKEVELIHPRICWSKEPLKSSLRIAELLLRAKVFKGTLTYHGREASMSSLHLDTGSSKLPLFERVDIPDSYFDNTAVQLILIGGTTQHWFFLIASVVDPENNPYVRIGRAYSPCNRIFKKLEEHFTTVESQMLTLR